MSFVSTRLLVVLAALAAGCALGDSGPDGAMTGMGWTPGEDDGATQGTDSPADDPADDNGDAPADGDTGSASCEFGCNEPPGDCYEPDGTCENDMCVYAPVLAGEPCNDDCTAGGFCDASGGCICASDDMGGDTGDTGGNPDDCMMTCTAGEHATAACNAMGECIVTCESPWEDCDGDPMNGCEVPVGVPHQCDAGGLNPNGGCWTAYCGSAQGADIADFGTYHCVDCPTCEQPSAGQCRWCNHDTGNWYPQDTCSCGGEFLDAVCSP